MSGYDKQKDYGGPMDVTAKYIKPTVLNDFEAPE